ncbi:MAG: MarR family transcriptional regulator [Infirmifilum sp.]
MVLMELLAVLSSAFAPLNVPKSSAFILALLYAIRKPLDTSEIERITGYSKSAVSAALKVLESHKLVNRFRSGRRNLYLPSTPLPRLLAESHIRMLKSINERLREISRRSPEVGEHLSHINSELIVAIKALEAGLHGIDNGGILKE